jgi:hypothetical protein
MHTGRPKVAGEHTDEVCMHELRILEDREPANNGRSIHTAGDAAVHPHPIHQHLRRRPDRQKTYNQPHRLSDGRPDGKKTRQTSRPPDLQISRPPDNNNNNMPLRFWKKETDLTQLKARVRRLETGRKNLATLKDVVKHWNDMATGNGLMGRIIAQELWREKTDGVLQDIMRDMTIIERKLFGLCPFGSELEAMSERATSESESSIRTVEQDASSVPLSPFSTPSTFTKRKGDGIERTALDTDGLRLSRPESNA